MGVEWMLLASLFVALSNFFMRRSIDAGGSTKGFLMVQFFFVCLIAILLNPVKTGIYGITTATILFGGCGGIVLSALMFSLGKALEKGPAGLTFAMLNASCVVPALVMALIFGMHYTIWHALGSFIVVLGLFLAGYQKEKFSKAQTQWLFFSLAAFGLHVLFLVLMQWRALLIQKTGDNSQWFMPIVFAVAFLIQSIVFKREKPERRAVSSDLIALPRRLFSISDMSKAELNAGVFGGLAQGVGTFFMIRSTEVATHVELPMLFPLFSVMVIVICSFWGKFIYKEKVKLLPTALCCIGVFVGTVDMGALLKG